MVRRELKASPLRVLCRMTVVPAPQQDAAAAAAALIAGGGGGDGGNGTANGSGGGGGEARAAAGSSGCSRVSVQLLHDRYNEVMSAVLEVRSLDHCTTCSQLALPLFARPYRPVTDSHAASTSHASQQGSPSLPARNRCRCRKAHTHQDLTLHPCANWVPLSNI